MSVLGSGHTERSFCSGGRLKYVKKGRWRNGFVKENGTTDFSL